MEEIPIQKSQGEICPNCGTVLAGRFCHVCGQRKIEDRERTLRHFLYQFFGSTFFLENNFIKSLWLLIAKPGFLASEYLAGKRKRYMPPISLFLLINLIYFFSVSLTDLNLSLVEQLHQPQHGSLARLMVEKRLAARSLPMEEYVETYNEQSTSLSKTLIVLHAPVLACLIVPLYWKKKYYFAGHMIFSLYLMAFVMLFSILLYNGLLALVKASIIEPKHYFQISGYFLLIAFPVYFGTAIKRFYQEPLWITIMKTAAVMLFFMLAHMVYRTVLFLVVFWTT